VQAVTLGHGTAANAMRVELPTDGTGLVSAAQSGTWNITNISGTVSLPTGAATSALQPTAAAQGSTTSGQTGHLMQCAVTTSAPSYTTAQTDPLSCDTTGNLRVNVVTATGLAQGSTTSGQTGSLVMGAVTTAAPSYTTAQTSPVSLTTAGGMRSDLASVAGTAIALGSAASSASLPVVMASNQTAADPCMFQNKTNVPISTASGST